MNRELDNLINKIHFGDCFELMKNLPDKSIDLVLTDPPYNITQCDWDIELNLTELIYELNRVSKRQVIFCTEPFTSKLILANEKQFCEKITWVKHRAPNFGNVNHRLLKYTEELCVFGKGTFNKTYQKRESARVLQAQKGNSKQWRTNRNGTAEVCFQTQYEPNDWGKYDAEKKLLGNVWHFPCVVSNSKEKLPHPTQKPVKLTKKILEVYSNEGDLILDPFSGSGTTSVACVQMHRRFICIEKDKKFFDMSINRLQAECDRLNQKEKND